ncbi:hypothetical protein JTB14_004162 [Gonioctena quinquepunctata]|nr:hypothetical protein JTB14_004162 [Gonioctena quinquepunctata]
MLQKIRKSELLEWMDIAGAPIKSLNLKAVITTGIPIALRIKEIHPSRKNLLKRNIRRKHTCGEIFCEVCMKHQPQDHLCFIQPDTRTPPSGNFHFIFYDLETRQEMVQSDGTLLHELRYKANTAKKGRLKSLGYDVIDIWESDFKRRLNDNKELQDYVENHPLVLQTPLNPRDAFYGGRTGNTFEYYRTQNNEKIKYVDVCSLYPWVCEYGKFPVGHPNVYVGSACPTLSLVSGLIRCKVLPPRELFLPVFPAKMNNKLMFVICRECGQNLNFDDCTHSDVERSSIGKWTVEEVPKGLFTDMMNKFIKIKQESSDWPSNCQTQAEKDRYIDRFLERENITLDFSKVIDNPGLRSLAKLILNFFWGKFVQRENQPKTSIVNQSAKFFRMMSNPTIYVNTVLPVNEDTLIVNWEYREEASDS